MKQPSTQLRVDCRNEEKMLHYCMVHRTSHVTARKNNTKQHSWSNNKNQKEKWIRSLMQIWWKSFLFSVFSEEQTEKLFPLTFSSPHQLMAGQAEKQIDEVNRCQVPPLRVKLCRLSPHFFLLFLFSVMCVHNAFSGCAQIVEPASECDGLVHTCDVDAETFFSPLAGDSHYREKKKDCTRLAGIVQKKQADGSCFQSAIHWHNFDGHFGEIFLPKISESAFCEDSQTSFLTFNCFCVSRNLVFRRVFLHVMAQIANCNFTVANAVRSHSSDTRLSKAPDLP